MGRPQASPRAELLALEHIGIKLGLSQIRTLVDALAHPDRAFRSVIVAGTNGKGSVAAMLERGLRHAGYRTGRFTSPHLVDLEERFAIDGTAIDAATLDATASRVLEAAAGLPAPPSFFEATTALALNLFRDAAVDVAVLEVGLGGRLDATNVVDALAAAITSVDLDHEEYLGGTLEAIAREKAGVVRRGALVVLADNPPAVDRAVSEVCDDVGAALVRASEGVSATVEMRDGRAHVHLRTPVRAYDGLIVALRGRHQVGNAVCAVRLLEALSAHHAFELPARSIRAAVEDAVWPGRLEPALVEGIEVLLDGAHNPAGARALARYILETAGRPVPMVVGAMRDKAIGALIAALAPGASRFLFTAASTPRAAAAADLTAAAASVAPSVPRSTHARPLAAIREAAPHGLPVVVAGSLHLVGEVRREVVRAS